MMHVVVIAQMSCDECGRHGPEFTRDKAREAARTFARAAGWKHRKRETPRTTVWVDICPDCNNRWESADEPNT
jgi:hypothetical protein